MRDQYFSYFIVALAGLASVLYVVRILSHGVAHSDRVGQIGGTALLGRGVMDFVYWTINPVVDRLVTIGATPNIITWCSLLFGVGAGIAVAFGSFGLASFLATLSTLGDILDGEVARLTKTGSDKGELFDAAVDRYTEFAFIGGLTIFYRDSLWKLVLALAALLACFMISYTSAKAEALQVKPPRGLMRRHERGSYLIVGAGFTAIFGGYMTHISSELPFSSFELLALGAVSLIGNAAAVLRLVRIGRSLR